MGAPQPIGTAVVTVSDSSFRGEREDRSGPAVAAEAERWDLRVVARALVPDEPDVIRRTLLELCGRPDVRLVFTTGGTGLSPRDHTPEATRALLEKDVPGIVELMRWESFKSTPRAALSRAVAGVRNGTLIINLPGSVKGATECLQAVAAILPHAVELIAGQKVQCGG